jgi:26S proteasome regulatory subunit T4
MIGEVLKQLDPER